MGEDTLFQLQAQIIILNRNKFVMILKHLFYIYIYVQFSIEYSAI